jgi:hypothetical protein
MKATAVGIASYIVFVVAWVWYFLRPGFDKATGVGALKSALWGSPLFWTLGFAVAFAGASVYLWTHR